MLTGQGASIDTTTPSGKLVFGIFASLAEFASEQSVTLARFNNGSRQILQGFAAGVELGKWQSLAVAVAGSKMAITLNGKLLGEVTDDGWSTGRPWSGHQSRQRRRVPKRDHHDSLSIPVRFIDGMRKPVLASMCRDVDFWGAMPSGVADGKDSRGLRQFHGSCRETERANGNVGT